MFTPSVVLDRRATVGGVYAEQAGGALPRALDGSVFIRAARHPAALIAGEQRQGLGVGGQPGGLAAGGEVSHAFQANKIRAGDDAWINGALLGSARV